MFAATLSREAMGHSRTSCRSESTSMRATTVSVPHSSATEVDRDVCCGTCVARPPAGTPPTTLAAAAAAPEGGTAAAPTTFRPPLMASMGRAMRLCSVFAEVPLAFVLK